MARRILLRQPSTVSRSFTIDYARELNEQQHAVVMASGSKMLVIAGAGSGKTRTLTYRVARLIESGVDPARILLVTFTNKAAREMLRRVDALLQQETRRLWGGTFHHIGNLILRAQASGIGYPDGYTILDREDSRTVMRQAVQDCKIPTGEKRFPRPNVLQSLWSLTLNTGRAMDELLTARWPQFTEWADELQGIFKRYTERKRSAGLMDYDDLLVQWHRLFSVHSDVRDFYARQFLHVLVDEYQDTNQLQGQLVDMLASAHGNLCVVGDDAQSIFRFRGADFENIIRFEDRHTAAEVYKLEINYRSTPEILTLANCSIAHNERQYEKRLRTKKPSGTMPQVVPCRDAQQQAEVVGHLIAEMLNDEGRDLRDIAVLFRSHWNALELELELNRRNIPYEVRGGLRFFEQAHIKDVVAFLRAVANPRDSLAWERIFPLTPKIGDRTTRKLVEHLMAVEKPLAEIFTNPFYRLVPRPARPFFAETLETFRSLTEPDAANHPAQMIETVVKSGYDEVLQERYPNAKGRMQDLKGLCEYAENHGGDLQSFLSEVALVGGLDAETAPVGPDEWDKVTLSTVHQAKGLEWPVVFVIWLADGRFPTDMAGREPGGVEEERRLFYVACTRAKDELLLIYPLTYKWKGMQSTALMKKSRFLAELEEGGAIPFERAEVEE